MNILYTEQKNTGKFIIYNLNILEVFKLNTKLDTENKNKELKVLISFDYYTTIIKYFYYKIKKYYYNNILSIFRPKIKLNDFTKFGLPPII